MGKTFSIFLILMSLSVFGVTPALSQEQTRAKTANDAVFNSSGQPIPRFITLASSKVFVRTGPALRYPIKWVFTKKGLPIEVIQEFDTWRKIRDLDGQEGWIHQSLLSGRRNALIQGEDNVFLRRKPQVDARAMAMLEPNVLVRLRECAGGWCAGEADGYEGWIEKKSLWGVYEAEEFN